jgi:hypothetical protein
VAGAQWLMNRLRTPNKTYSSSRIRENSEAFLSSHELSYGFVSRSYSSSRIRENSEAFLSSHEPSYGFVSRSYSSSRIRENSEAFLSSHEPSYGFVSRSYSLTSSATVLLAVLNQQAAKHPSLLSCTAVPHRKSALI